MPLPGRHRTDRNDRSTFAMEAPSFDLHGRREYLLHNKGDEHATPLQDVTPMTTLAITGAAGRMGQRLIALAKLDGSFDVVAAIERADHPAIGGDAGTLAGAGPIGVPLAADDDRDAAGVDRLHRLGLHAPLAEDLPRPEGRDGDRHDRVAARRPRLDRPGGGRRRGPPGAEHESRCQPAVQGGGRGGQAARGRLRHRDRRGAPPLQEGRPQRHGHGVGRRDPQVDRQGPGRAVLRPPRRRGRPQSAARSACTPCASATRSAATRRTSPPSANGSN